MVHLDDQLQNASKDIQRICEFYTLVVDSDHRLKS